MANKTKTEGSGRKKGTPNKFTHEIRETLRQALAGELDKLSETLDIQEDSNYDDWDEFLTLLTEVPLEEKYFLLDLLSIAAAFDGRLSRLERQYLPEAFGELTEVYMKRIEMLKDLLLTGQLHAAKKLCKLDFKPG